MSSLSADDEVRLKLRARINKIQMIEYSVKELSLNGHEKFDDKWLKEENFIVISISYNGYKNIKVCLLPSEESKDRNQKFCFVDPSKQSKSVIPFSLYYHKTSIPLPNDGMVFKLDDSFGSPIIDKKIGLDLYISESRLKNIYAANYVANLQLVIVEME